MPEPTITVHIEPAEEPAYAEGGWGWVVCAASFLVTFVVFGIHNSFGAIYSNLVDNMKMDEAESAWVGSMAGSLNFLAGPAVSFLCNRYGCRAVAFTGAFLSVLGLLLTSFVQETAKMYVTYGLLWGLGSSFSFIPSIIVLGQYFHRRFSLANGIASSGTGIGSLIAVPFVNYLLTTVGWQHSMRVLASFALLLVFPACLYRPVSLSMANERLSERAGSVSSVWKCKPYVVFVCAVALFQFCYPVPYMHLIQFSKSIGVSQSHGAWLLGILSITATASKVIFGRISELRCINRLKIFQLAIFTMGLGTALCPLVTNFAGILIYSLVYGLFDGCFVGLVPVLTADTVGHERLSQGLGNMFGIVAVPMSFGPPIAGWLYQSFNSYDGAFIVAGGCAIVTSFILFLIPFYTHKERKSPLDVTIIEQSLNRTQTIDGVGLRNEVHLRYLKSGAILKTLMKAPNVEDNPAEQNGPPDDLSWIENVELTEKETVL